MTTTATPASRVSPDLGRRLYGLMTLAAGVDERLRKGIRNGEFGVHLHSPRGHEAVAAGLGTALRSDDRLVATYRGLHVQIAKGVPLAEVIGEILGRSAGAARGKSGSMHVTCPEAGLMHSTGIVGSGVPVAVGVALAARRQGSSRVTAVCFGDGAANTGSFHEGLNLAAVWRLPVVFVCENNLWAEMTPVHESMRVETVAERAAGYGMPGVRVDGNDPEAVYEAIATAAKVGRAGGGPSLVECMTFRLAGHSTGDAHHYMPEAQLAAAHAADPVPAYRRSLLERGVLNESELAAIDTSSASQVATALAAVLESPPPGPAEVDRDVYADMEGIPS
ncbi:thiamine pyrophosphate-dependent dehydrogenase E1 component subunit alpha [Amycolatopsis pithecellobii]|uniref:Thiamine pyrophosphate-dependent dehydrogenase E1 component subunit alpha n=1 Tax=Amycolatopsis pithecellobii TaxID=664692 RepID=A0A6N7YRJ9_9PSEU|nr:thiamine pyrophosphate-dependent dehydrogenase E1 component subunit alpha [Amycolatopsis pithecellobii]MTD55657.1 thiamine pyrophosphate-dependent dehydrogenase E1 component subunit alpha [Amycolatopsis pithecellobii]